MKVLAVALNAYREARRDRAQWILALYVAVLLGGATILSPLALGEGYRVTRDLGLAAISLIGVILIMLVGGGMVHKEVERRTVFTVLAKPLRRWEFLVGKYLGLWAMVASVFLTMVVCLALVLLLFEGRVEPAVLAAALFTLGELTVMTAVVVAFSTFATPALASVFTLAAFILGHFSQDLLRFAEKMDTGASGIAWTARGVYLILPHLHLFNLRGEAAYGVLPDPARVASCLLYAVLYSASLLLVASVVFSRREFR